ncbi:5958_t:CDS:2, partial [Entrophospora sp. SA101]
MLCTPTKSEESILEDHLLRITVSNGLAFRWIESEEVKSLFRWLNPNIRLPNRKALSGRILNDASLKHNSWIKEQASNSEYGVTVALDGWLNVVNEKILGVILITNEGETLVWNAYDISGERSRTQEVLQHITLIFEDLQSKNIMINAVVTDSAAEYAAARRQLHVQHTDKVFIPCFAHQVNLCIGEIFKESYRMKLVAKDAVAIASYFNNVNHAYWIKRLRDEQMDLYRNTYGLVSPNDTRWNSNYDCYVSLLRSKGALKTLVTKYQATRNLRTNERSFVLSDNLCQIISNEEWWEDVEELKDLMEPFARCEEDIEDGDTITKTITTNEEIEAYFRTCERMIQEERAAIEDENISNFIFLPAEDVFDLVGETEHPANNKDAKWAIKDLFKPLDINL